jgi:hypothetical protein
MNLTVIAHLSFARLQTGADSKSHSAAGARRGIVT